MNHGERGHLAFEANALPDAGDDRTHKYGDARRTSCRYTDQQYNKKGEICAAPPETCRLGIMRFKVFSSFLLAAEFDVSKEAAQEVLDELRDRRLIEKLYTGKYITVNWRDRDDADSTRHPISAA